MALFSLNNFGLYRTSVIFLTLCLSTPIWAQKAPLLAVEQVETSDGASTKNVEVGQHVMANIDATSMILSLAMVLGLVVLCALLLKRFNIVHQSNEHLKLISTLSLGPKERVVVIQAGKEQFLLGINSASNSGQITVIDKLKQTLETKKTVNEKRNKVDSLCKATTPPQKRLDAGTVLSLIKKKTSDYHSNHKK
tara:strand:- start:1177 stop:1758 length:582 start_codon:yes stop_codon:yes gene_type:complete